MTLSKYTNDWTGPKQLVGTVGLTQGSTAVKTQQNMAPFIRLGNVPVRKHENEDNDTIMNQGDNCLE